MINRRRFIQLSHATTLLLWLQLSRSAFSYWDQCTDDCWCEFDDDDDSPTGNVWCYSVPEPEPTPTPPLPAPPPPTGDDEGAGGQSSLPWLGGGTGGDPINVATGGAGGNGTLVFQANSDWNTSNTIGGSFALSGSYSSSSNFGVADNIDSIRPASNAATSDSGRQTGSPTTTGTAGGDDLNRLVNDVFIDSSSSGLISAEGQSLIGTRGGAWGALSRSAGNKVGGSDMQHCR